MFEVLIHGRPPKANQKHRRGDSTKMSGEKLELWL
jgi:hypothetical protein